MAIVNSLYIQSLKELGMHIDLHTDQPGKYLLLDLEHSRAYKGDSKGELHLISDAETLAVLDAYIKWISLKTSSGANSE